MDGRRQRRALTAAEQAIAALAGGDAPSARRGAQRAAELDQLGIYIAFTQLATRAAEDVEAGHPVSPRMWAAIRDALGPGPLAESAQRHLDDSIRSAS